MAAEPRIYPSRRSRFEIRDNLWKWIFLLPAVIVILILLTIPVLWTLYAAFTDLHLYRIGDFDTKFVGLANFQKLLGNRSFWRTVRNTVVFMLEVVPTQLIIGLTVALALNNITRGQKLFPHMVSDAVDGQPGRRLLYRWPHVVPGRHRPHQRHSAQHGF